jgi:hypothetical protein
VDTILLCLVRDLQLQLVAEPAFQIVNLIVYPIVANECIVQW